MDANGTDLQKPRGAYRMVDIIEATESDQAAIRHIHLAAFGPTEGREIADLVDELVKDATAAPLLSLIARADHAPIGHILFTAVTLEGGAGPVSARILAPLGVMPDHQGRGVGSALVNEGLKRLAESQVDLVFVLGHPGYYPRYGFEPAGVHRLNAPYPIAPANADAWMVKALGPGLLGRVQGTIRCADALNHRRYWVE